MSENVQATQRFDFESTLLINQFEIWAERQVGQKKQTRWYAEYPTLPLNLIRRRDEIRLLLKMADNQYVVPKGRQQQIFEDPKDFISTIEQRFHFLLSTLGRAILRERLLETEERIEVCLNS